MIRRKHLVCVAALLAQVAAASGWAQSPTASTYQGRLIGEAGPVDGAATLMFRLFDSPTGGTLLAGPVTVPDVTVVDGLFTSDLDFGSYFADTGKPGWLEITVMAGGDPVTLAPRQRLAPAPLATGLVTQTRVDVSNTNDVDGPRVSGLGGSVPAYVTFQAQSSGKLAGVVFRANAGSAYTPTFFGQLRRGQGVEGQLLGDFAQDVSITLADREFTIDLSMFDVQVVEGQWYTVTILCGVAFATTSEPSATVSGVSSNGDEVNWWFKALLQAPTRALVTDSQHALHAERAESAVSAQSAKQAQASEYANRAFEAEVLNAQFVSGLNNWELRLSNISNSSSGLAHFGLDRPFGNIGFAPNGPVLFGDGGGGLGTRQNAPNGVGKVALTWNSDGNVFVTQNLTVDQELSVVGSVGVVANLTVGGRIGLGTPVSSAGYRLELPNVASPTGQGRANAWVTYSSRKFKDQIETLHQPLAMLSALRGVSFVWNTPLEDGTFKHDIGFIAEEVAEAAPELVTRTASGEATGLDYGKVVPITVEAIKAQQRQIEQLRAENAALTKRLEQIEKSLQSHE